MNKLFFYQKASRDIFVDSQKEKWNGGMENQKSFHLTYFSKRKLNGSFLELRGMLFKFF
jgi:hypothetical protein